MAIPNEYEYILNINSLYTKDYGDSTYFPDIYENDTWHSAYSDGPLAQVNNRDYTLVSIGSTPFNSGNCNYHIASSAIYNTGDVKFAPFSPAYAEINVDQSQYGYTITYPNNFINDNPYQYPQGMRGVELGKDSNIGFFYLSVDYGVISLRTDFSDLSSAIAYIYAMFSNIVLYVDGEKWIDDRPVSYNWVSVPSVSGKNGILSFSTIKQASINDGNPVTGATIDDVNLSDQTKLSTLMENIPRGMEVEAIYAGSVDYMSLKRDNPPAITTSAKFYMSGSSAPFYTLSGLVQTTDYLSFLIDEENEVVKPSIIRKTSNIPATFTYNNETPTETEMQQLYLWLHSHIDNDDDDPELNGEDDGTDQNKWTDIAISGLSKPTASAINTGFTSMYMITDTELRSLSDYMWSSSFLDNVKNKLYGDPKDVIVGLSIMPVIPDHAGSTSKVKAGGVVTDADGYILTDQYKILPVGTCNIKTEKGNFLDFPPFTKVTAHLPFVGEHSLDVNDIMGKTISLQYIFDFLTGSCVAEIDVNGKPRYFFGGSCGVQVPISAGDFARMWSSILSAGASVGSTLATMATGGLTAPLLIGAAANQVTNGMTMAPDVKYSSGEGSINGLLSYQTAFLTVEYPIDKRAKDQYGYLGRPSFIKRKLQDCSGYIKCLNVHLDKVACYDTERNTIENLLLEGVRIETGSDTPSYTPTETGDVGIVFLKCISDKNVIGKSWKSETGDSVTREGKLLFNQDILAPTFLIGYNTLEFNYCYIPKFKRFYYIKDQIVKERNMIEVHMQVDELQSWKTDILKNYAILERSEKKADVNAYFNDAMLWTQQNKTVLTVPFLTSEEAEAIFARENNCYILTVAGG